MAGSGIKRTRQFSRLPIMMINEQPRAASTRALKDRGFDALPPPHQFARESP